MTAYIIDKNGAERRLPPLLSWELEYADCDAGGAFEVKLLYDSGLKDALHASCALRAVHAGKTVLCGVIDEYRVTAGPVGITATVSGRTAEAVLMDNECEAAEYSRMTLKTLVKTYVQPYFDGSVELGEEAAVRDLTVASGASAWSVLCTFMTLAGLPRPVCTAEGTLYLGTLPPAKSVRLQKGSLDSAQLRDCRYGMASEYTVINRIRGRRYEACDDDFISRGGCARRVLNVDRNVSLDAMKKTAENRIALLNRNKHTVTVKTPLLFAAQPGDTVSVCEKLLGVCGEYKVTQCRVYADEFRSYTEICAEVRD